jgi:hypothetical protein
MKMVDMNFDYLSTLVHWLEWLTWSDESFYNFQKGPFIIIIRPMERSPSKLPQMLVVVICRFLPTFCKNQLIQQLLTTTIYKQSLGSLLTTNNTTTTNRTSTWLWTIDPDFVSWSLFELTNKIAKKNDAVPPLQQLLLRWCKAAMMPNKMPTAKGAAIQPSLRA